MKLNIQQKIIIALSQSNTTQKELAKKIGMSPQVLSNRLKSGKFVDDELGNIAKALGCEYRSGFYWEDGRKIE